MALSKFDKERWDRVFNNIKLVKFMTKTDVMDGKIKIAELNIDNYITSILYSNIKVNYGKNIVDKVISITGQIENIYYVKYIVYIKCDDLELARNGFGSMAEALFDIGIVDNKTNTYYRMLRLFKDYGYDFYLDGYHFKVITENEIY